MRSLGVALLACLLVVSSPATAKARSAADRLALATGPAATVSVGDRVPGELIVRFEPGTNPAERRAARNAAGVEFLKGVPLARAQVVAGDGGRDARRLQRQPDVAYVQPNYRYEALAEPPPDDTFFDSLWGLEDSVTPNPGVDALPAWSTTRGDGQVIAIVDTGVAADHPDIAPNLWDGPGSTYGFDFVDGDSDPDDFQVHGTHVAGTAAAVAGNDLGIAGVAPNAQIMAVRALDGDGSGSSADIGSGISYASQNGADVINLSLGGAPSADDHFMSDAIDVAAQHDTVVVAAAGNDTSDNDVELTRPCTFPQANLICVAAIDQAGDLAWFSSFGQQTVDVAAPGTSILSARTDYASVMTEDFEGTLSAWDTFTDVGGFEWELTTAVSDGGAQSVTDSPDGLYANNSDSELFTASPVDLTTERGCRMHMELMYDIEDPDLDGSLFDALFVGAVTNDSSAFDLVPFAGESPSYDVDAFTSEEVSISDVSGRPDVFPIFALLSDASIREDGAYVDDLELLCRDDDYVDATGSGGNYVSFQGTSMAAPHVAGVAALVRAADPGAPATQVVEAIKSGGASLPGLAGTTVSGRTAHAPGAIAAALSLPNQPPAPVQPASVPPPPVISPTRPAKPRLPRQRRIRLTRRGVFAYVFRATPGLTGRAVFRTRGRVKVARRARLTIARRRFRVPASGRVRLRIRLSPRKLRIVRRNRGRLGLIVKVAVRNADQLTARASRRAVLVQPRRRT